MFRQTRETLEEAGLSFVSLEDNLLVTEDESGYQEVWALNDNYAGYVIVYKGQGYEYAYGVKKINYQRK